MKKCSNKNCKEESPRFAKSSSAKDGLQSNCTGCRHQYYLRNKERLNARSKADWHARKAHYMALQLKWQRANRDIVNKNTRKYKATHKDVVNAQTEKRRQALKKATPNWLTKEQKKQMTEFYKNKPKGYSVDHIVPLQGGTVRGLHVPWNLQYLTVSENAAKHNYIPSGAI